ncbi:MAG: hypothetical protein MJZ23_04910 [Paludibacteraceae bacterium]|nr:hypothetical protein [Paludibacteraceae bacterium]
MLNIVTLIKNKSADKLVVLFLKVMKSVVKSWHQRAETQSLPVTGQNPNMVKHTAIMLAIDVLLALTQLLLNQAQQHYTNLDQLNK